MFIAGIILLSYEFFRSNLRLRNIPKGSLGLLFLLGFLNIYLTNIAEIWGLKRMISAQACLIYSLSPFFSALVSFIVFRETLTNKKWLGLILGFCGIIPLLFQSAMSPSNKLFFLFDSAAELAIVIAVISSVIGWVILRKLICDFEYSPVAANGFSMLLGGFLALLHSYFSGENWSPIPVTQYFPFFINTLSMCLISNIICYNLYGYLLKRYTATFMSFAGLITPLFASLFGWLMLGESVSASFFLSFAIFSIALILFHQEEVGQQGMKVKVSTTP